LFLVFEAAAELNKNGDVFTNMAQSSGMLRYRRMMRIAVESLAGTAIIRKLSFDRRAKEPRHTSQSAVERFWPAPKTSLPMAIRGDCNENCVNGRSDSKITMHRLSRV
jgi:hypothetical protein